MSGFPPRLAGKVAVVTGAAHGIGAGCARMFARHGATVIGCDIDATAAERAERAVADEDAAFRIAAPCDLTDEDAVTTFVAEVARDHSRIDILVNAAAFAVFAPVDALTFADWRRTLAGELDIVFLLTRQAWPLLRASGAASIVNFASANARHALEGSPALAHCAGKGGILAMTRQLAMEGAPHGIRANTISPGFIRTAATERHLAADPAFGQRVLARNMLKRFGTPEDIAWCATWLASDEASYVTGADFAIDAGATAW